MCLRGPLGQCWTLLNTLSSVLRLYVLTPCSVSIWLALRVPSSSPPQMLAANAFSHFLLPATAQGTNPFMGTSTETQWLHHFEWLMLVFSGCNSRPLMKLQHHCLTCWLPSNWIRVLNYWPHGIKFEQRMKMGDLVLICWHIKIKSELKDQQVEITIGLICLRLVKVNLPKSHLGTLLSSLPYQPKSRTNMYTPKWAPLLCLDAELIFFFHHDIWSCWRLRFEKAITCFVFEVNSISKGISSAVAFMGNLRA